MAKTIADLGNSDEKPKSIIGRSMVDTGGQPVSARIDQLKASRQAEQEALEQAGYDYNGNEDWIRAMTRLGRR